MGLRSREERLLPGGRPRYVWLYEGGGGSGAGYTAVFTGLLSTKRPGEYPVLAMGEDRDGGEGYLLSGRPPSGRMRREIPFDHLPEVHRAAVLDTYRRLWNL